MDFNTIEQDSAPKKVAHQLIQNINSGKMESGQKLPPHDDLAKMFGVGRSSIREALNVLAVMGYVEIQQGRGTFIKKEIPSESVYASSLTKSFKDTSPLDLLETREVLECYAVKQASMQADDTGIQKLKEVTAKLERSVDDEETFLKTDQDFHLAIAEATNNTVCAELIKFLHDMIHARYTLVFATQDRYYREKTIETAIQITAYIENGEDKKAVRCMRSHLRFLKEMLISMFAKKL